MQEDYTSTNNFFETTEFDNAVVLLGYYGGDKTHCLSAWQSTCLEYPEVFELDGYADNRITVLYDQTIQTKKKDSLELLTYLAEAGHHTPFEKSFLHFQVRADIATHIHFLKHRIGVSINTESARYKELSDKYYLPTDWACYDGVKIDLNSLTSNYVYILDDQDDPEVVEEELIDVLDWYASIGHELYHVACEKLTPIVGRKRAKETARYFLPYCKQVDFDVAFNFRSFMHFQGLRNSPHAQMEIATLAQRMIELVANIPGNPFKDSLQAFGYAVPTKS